MKVIERSTQLDIEPTNAGWHDDPKGEHKLRYFDGRIWTNHVTHFGPTPCAWCRSGNDAG